MERKLNIPLIKKRLAELDRRIKQIEAIGINSYYNKIKEKNRLHRMMYMELIYIPMMKNKK